VRLPWRAALAGRTVRRGLLAKSGLLPPGRSLGRRLVSRRWPRLALRRGRCLLPGRLLRRAEPLLVLSRVVRLRLPRALRVLLAVSLLWRLRLVPILPI